MKVSWRDIIFFSGILLICIFVLGYVVNTYKTEVTKVTTPKPVKQVEISQAPSPDVLMIGDKIIYWGQEFYNHILTLKPTLDPSVAREISKAIADASIKHSIPGELIIAIMMRESSFNITAVSEANCVGLMQINPETWKEEIKKKGWSKSEVFHIHNNVDLGTWIFKQYYEKSESVQKALVSYLGALNTKYVLDILDTYANLTIKISVPESEEISEEN